MIGIYKITNPKGKIYVGQSIDIDRRFKEYKNLKCIQQPKIFNSLNKYGSNNHIFEVLELCIIKSLSAREVYWKIFYNSVDCGLNCELYDNGVGPRSEETKQKISRAQMGNTYNLGKKQTDETKKLKSLAAIGIPKPPGFGNKISSITKGRKHPSKNKIIKDNNTGIVYNSCTEASIALGISRSIITNSLNNIYNKSKYNFTYE
jgi:group I intron endonuclease